MEYRCFLKWWYQTTIGSPTKNDHFGVFCGYHHLRKHPYIEMNSLLPSILHQWPSPGRSTHSSLTQGFPHHLIHFIQSFPILHGYQLSIRETSLTLNFRRRASEHQGVGDEGGRYMGVFPKISPKWMVKIMENILLKWMIWGENPLFSETPIFFQYMLAGIHGFSFSAGKLVFVIQY